MPSGRRVDGRNGGRILVHTRPTDDTTPTIGAYISLQEEHTFAITVTEDQSMNARCRVDYRNRINRIMTWVESEYPSYFEEGTRLLSEEELRDPTKFHHKNKRDLLYPGINANVIKAFLSDNKYKGPTKKNPRTDRGLISTQVTAIYASTTMLLSGLRLNRDKCYRIPTTNQWKTFYVPSVRSTPMQKKMAMLMSKSRTPSLRLFFVVCVSGPFLRAMSSCGALAFYIGI